MAVKVFQEPLRSDVMVINVLEQAVFFEVGLVKAENDEEKDTNSRLDISSQL